MKAIFWIGVLILFIHILLPASEPLDDMMPNGVNRIRIFESPISTTLKNGLPAMQLGSIRLEGVVLAVRYYNRMADSLEEGEIPFQTDIGIGWGRFLDSTFLNQYEFKEEGHALHLVNGPDYYEYEVNTTNVHVWDYVEAGPGDKISIEGYLVATESPEWKSSLKLGDYDCEIIQAVRVKVEAM